jgi:sucrose-6-phosphate hydrolase SacC (GH32 family)
MRKDSLVTALALVTLFSITLQVGAAETHEKTLVSWASMRYLGQTAGSVLTLQRGQEFDAIVFGELKEGKWMAGSHNLARTKKEQGYAQETKENELIQMAVVYEADQVTLYRNGKPLTTYPAENIDLLSGDDQVVVFGLRHIGGNGYIAGTIEDARIYAKALNAEELKSLEANKPSAIEPWAWWDFEGEKAKDRTGRFTHTRMANAVIDGGRLRLGEMSALAFTRNKETMTWAVKTQPRLVNPEEYEPEILTMPDDVPENWLTYHLAHTGPDPAEPGDPNPMFYYGGRYHLHYIYLNEYGFCFAHVSSADMVNWKWHPTTLAPPMTGHGMFSGTGFFTKEGKPAAIYHGEGSGKNWIVYGLDDKLEKWTKPEAINAKSKSDEDVRYWDPDCWLRNGTYYAISGGEPPLYMKSKDLKEWEYLGKLFHEDTDFEALGLKPNEDVSCANMFKIGNKWMLLCISHELGCRYYLGDFKDEKYLPESHFLMNWKEVQYFAPESVLTPDGRRVMWTWCTDTLPLSSSQTGVQALPREISLPDDGVLRIKPLRELRTLRYDEKNEGEIKVDAGNKYRLKELKGNTVELSVTIEPTKAQAYGVRVFCDEDGEGMPIRYLPKEKKLAVADVKAPLELKKGESLQLSIFLDKDMVEVFANDRQAITTGQKNGYKKTAIELFSKGDAIQATVKGWKIRSTY